MKNNQGFNREIIQLIIHKMDEKRVTQVELAKGLNIQPSSVSRILKGNNLSVDKLRQISILLDFNFFSLLAGYVEVSEPKETETAKKGTDHSQCNERIRELEIENRTLLKVLHADR